ncbi:MAG: DUF3524 domain-containing protein [Proteobacteria bacterium]|nr:DUF3524 domain-containing protein [Pseudomonadota bacterium]
MKVLLLSAYDAASHRYWREGLVDAFPEYEWTVVSLPPRHFNWRLRGNSLSWAFGGDQRLDSVYDLLFTTSMTDLSALRGFLPSLSRLPAIAYFHENQFAYPDSGRQFPSVEPRILNLYTALAADRLVFNSAYNRDTFLEGVEALLRKMPDQVPPGLVGKLSRAGSILSVPLRERRAGNRPSESLASAKHRPFTIVWNHRWEYDKAPERLLGALLELKKRGIDFNIHVVGQQFRSVPSAFREIRSKLGSAVGEWGFIEDDERYGRVLAESHVVVSTALHDFQGLAVLEAVASGCLPLVPNRLAYPEFFPEDCLYPSNVEDMGKERKALADSLERLARAHIEGRLPSPPDLSQFTWTRCKPHYRSIMEKTVAAGRTPRGPISAPRR